jgi:hypothetical protein
LGGNGVITAYVEVEEEDDDDDDDDDDDIHKRSYYWIRVI